VDKQTDEPTDKDYILDYSESSVTLRNIIVVSARQYFDHRKVI